MSESQVRVVQIGAITKHPNADSLSIADVEGYPCILRTGEFAEGDKAVYLPVDSVVPADDGRWTFLGGHRRIKAKRLRGIFSMGLLTAADPSWNVGDDVAAAMRIEKYEPSMQYEIGGENAPDDNRLPHYTDVEGLRRWRNVLEDGEEVVLTEKIHGANARFVSLDGKLIIGSRTRIKAGDGKTIWTAVAEKLELAERLAKAPGIAFYGEVFGQVQDLKYGAKQGELRLRVFDALDTSTRTYLDYDRFGLLAAALGFDQAPELYRGPWRYDLVSLAEGKTTMPGADHVREGFVVRPVKERVHPRLGRVLLKMVGEGYLLRKGA